MNVPLINRATRSLGRLFPQFFGGGTKQDFYKDFGWPTEVGFPQFHSMYLRNGLATAAVDRTVSKTWETHPWLWEVQPEDHGDESPLETDIRKHFAKLRFWQSLIEADRRSLVGEYSALILRVADGQMFDQPVSGGLSLEDLVEVIPVWEGQLTVAEWNDDQTSPDFGQPSFYQFSETEVTKGKKARQFRIHPDRVVIWSADGTIHGKSLLQAGYNDLLDMQKVSGAGGEGFWKNAKSAPVLEVEQEANIQDLAMMMGVPPDQIADKLGEVIGDWQRGLDELLMLKGIQAKTLQVQLPSPEHFHNIPLTSFAASIQMPVKILIGSQTGERASSEDRAEWNQTNMSRRENVVIPNISAVVDRLVQFGMLPDLDWSLSWTSLTESSTKEKVEIAYKLSEINSKEATLSGPAFTIDEIREAAGYEAFTPEQEREIEELEEEARAQAEAEAKAAADRLAASKPTGGNSPKEIER